LAKLPDLTYPSPFVIKNTFIQSKAQPSFDSLADFFEERKIRSCPVSEIVTDERDNRRRVSRAATTDCGALAAAAAEVLAQDEATEEGNAEARYALNYDIFDTASTFGVCESPAHWDLPDWIGDECANNDAVFDTVSTFQDLELSEGLSASTHSAMAWHTHDFQPDFSVESPTNWPCHIDFAGCEVAAESQAHHVFEQQDPQYGVAWATAEDSPIEYDTLASDTFAMHSYLRPAECQRRGRWRTMQVDSECQPGEGEAESYIKTLLGLATQPSQMTNHMDDVASMSCFDNTSTQMPPPPPVQPPTFDASQRQFQPPPPPPPQGPPPLSAPVLLLAEALPTSATCADAFPSIGSQSHVTGTCQPCAFFYTQGCQNGHNCQFCHLCGPGEKKKRLREKRMARREAKLNGFLSASGEM
jgi:hypothetical protein